MVYPCITLRGGFQATVLTTSMGVFVFSNSGGGALCRWYKRCSDGSVTVKLVLEERQHDIEIDGHIYGAMDKQQLLLQFTCRR